MRLKALWYRIRYPRIEYLWPAFELGKWERKRGWFVGLTTTGNHPSNRRDRAMIIDDNLDFQLTDQERIKRII